MRILYIFPHPDDESFGPARAMSKQLRQGHEVYLFTMTKGGATKQRFKYDYSIEEMGEVRYREMLDVEKTLGLSGMKVIDLPDSGLKEMDPREIEQAVHDEIMRIKPAVVVTYAVHGTSGFHDHLVSHAVVKRAFVEIQDKEPWLKRLAFFTMPPEEAEQGVHFKLSYSTREEIDCIFDIEAEDTQNNLAALDCYVTFLETIEKSGVKNFLDKPVSFEFYRESFDPPVDDIFARLD